MLAKTQRTLLLSAAAMAFVVVTTCFDAQARNEIMVGQCSRTYIDQGDRCAEHFSCAGGQNTQSCGLLAQCLQRAKDQYDDCMDRAEALAHETPPPPPPPRNHRDGPSALTHP